MTPLSWVLEYRKLKKLPGFALQSVADGLTRLRSACIKVLVCKKLCIRILHRDMAVLFAQVLSAFEALCALHSCHRSGRRNDWPAGAAGLGRKPSGRDSRNRQSKHGLCPPPPCAAQRARLLHGAALARLLASHSRREESYCAARPQSLRQPDAAVVQDLPRAVTARL